MPCRFPNIAIAAASSLQTPTSPVSSTSAGSRATWKRPSTRCGAKPGCIVPPDSPVSFPRVALSIDFKAPLFFEDEFEVHVRLTAVSRRSLTYAHTIRRGDTVIATGTMTAVCVRKSPLPMKAVEIPAEIVERLGTPST